MKTILSFGASTSSTSINQELANYAAKETQENVIELKLSDFEMPIFSMDREQNQGIPEKAKQFKDYIEQADAIVISFAEHNGMVSSAFKNIYDWVSRINMNVWSDKPMFLLATSPGPKGGQTVLDFVSKDFNNRGGKVISSFSLPSYFQNFDKAVGIQNEDLKASFNIQLNKLTELLEAA